MEGHLKLRVQTYKQIWYLDISKSQTSQSKNHDPKPSASSQPSAPALSLNQPSAPVISSNQSSAPVLNTNQTAESSLPVVIEDLNEEEKKSTETGI